MEENNKPIIYGKLKMKFPVIELNNIIKREFVVVTDEDYPQQLKFELLNNRINLLDNFNIGDMIEVHFNLCGREWYSSKDNKMIYFMMLRAWRIKKLVERGNYVYQPTQDKPLVGAQTFNFPPAADVFDTPTKYEYEYDDLDLPF